MSPVVSVLVTLAVTAVAVVALAKKMSDRLKHYGPFDPDPYRARHVCCDTDRLCTGFLAIRDVSAPCRYRASGPS